MTSSLPNMKRISLLLLAMLALAAAGCGSGSDDNNSSANPSNNGSGSGSSADTRTTENAGTSAGSGADSQTVTIDMKDIKFNPSSATVKVGQTVKWVNDDSAPHNVTGGPLKSNTFGKGGSFEFKPKKAETISYVCTVHPNMKATLKVTS
jgi:plastocyanin